MLEANALHGVGKLDVHAEVVRVELELVPRLEAAILVDVERERRHVAVEVPHDRHGLARIELVGAHDLERPR